MHGEPASYRAPVRFYSRPQPWVALLLLIPLLTLPLFIFGVLPWFFAGGRRLTWIVTFLPYLLAWQLTRSRLDLPRWPFCERCRERSRRLRLIGLGVVAVAVAVAVAGICLYAAGFRAVGAVLAFVAVIVAISIGLSFIAVSRVTVLPKGAMSADGARLILQRVNQRVAAAIARPDRIHAGRSADSIPTG